MTNILDLSAEEIAESYKKRWSIEVFFRFIKQNLQFKNFVSNNMNGMQVYLYCILIAAILFIIFKISNKLTRFKMVLLKFTLLIEKELIKDIVLFYGGNPNLVELKILSHSNFRQLWVYILRSMVNMAKELGLRSKKNCHLNKTVIHRLIQQPFYYGEMRVKGEMWSHGYQAIITKETLSYLKNTNELKKAEHDQTTASLKKEHTENENRLNSLIDLRLNGELSTEEFQRKKQQLKDRQYEIDRLLKTYDEADDKFTDTATTLITLASEAYETFKGSEMPQKRKMINFVFQNLKLRGKKLETSLRFPFDIFEKTNTCTKWRAAWCTLRTFYQFRLELLQIPLKANYNKALPLTRLL